MNETPILIGGAPVRWKKTIDIGHNPNNTSADPGFSPHLVE